MHVGVLALQGDVSEHITMTKKAMDSVSIKGKVSEVKTRREIRNLNALIIPGGESTTIGKLICKYKMDSDIRSMAENGIPIMGTCAGLVLLAREGDEEIERTKQPLLELMNIKVNRNAFGRQRESFETDLKIPVLGKEPYHAVFIRAPTIEKIWGETRILAEYEGRIVVAQENNLLALSFHPELSNDLRMHEYFIRMVE